MSQNQDGNKILLLSDAMQHPDFQYLKTSFNTVENLLSINEELMKKLNIDKLKSFTFLEITHYLEILKFAASVRPKKWRFFIQLFALLLDYFPKCSGEIVNNIYFAGIFRFMPEDHPLRQRILNLYPNLKQKSNSIECYFKPNTFLSYIIDDDIEKLQNYVNSLPEFNFDQKIQISNTSIEKCFYCSGISLLDFAAYFGSLKCLKYFMLNDINFTSNTKYFATAGGNPNLINLLESRDIDFKDTLNISIEFNHYDITDYLLLHYEYTEFPILLSINQFNDPAFLYFYLNNPHAVKLSELLKEACKYHRVAVGKYLLQKSKETQMSKKDQQSLYSTTLQAAISSNTLQIAKYVLDEFNISPNIKGSKSKPLLHIAIENDNFNIIPWLFENYHVDVELTDKSHQTALHLLCQKNYLPGVKYLIEKAHANVDAKDKNNNTPLHIACQYGNKDIILYLLEKTQNINHANNNGKTPLNLIDQLHNKTLPFEDLADIAQAFRQKLPISYPIPIVRPSSNNY